MACVALPTCGLALAESERYLPELIAALDERLAAHGLSADDIVIRMTGCPNGCARPYLAEIGLVGKGPGRYNLYLGAAFDGSRLSKLYAEDLDHAGIVAALDPIFAAYAAERQPGERFGDFTIRAGFVARTGNGRDFHANTGKDARRERALAPTVEASRLRMDALARLPVFFALDGKRAVVAGGSAAAAWKAELLSAAGAQVDVYAAEPCDEMLALASDPPRGADRHHRPRLDGGRSSRRRACDRRFRGRRSCRRFAAAARAAGVPVNVDRQAGVLRFLLRRHRQPLAAGDRHFDRRRGAGLRAGDPRQARSVAAAGILRSGPRRPRAGAAR